MAYDTELANRLRECLQGEDGLTERAMFGGLAFLVGGTMAVSASGTGGTGGILLRVDPDETDQLAAQPHAARFVMRGRELNGWLRIDPAGIETDQELASWVRRGVDYARSLPRK